MAAKEPGCSLEGFPTGCLIHDTSLGYQVGIHIGFENAATAAAGPRLCTSEKRKGTLKDPKPLLSLWHWWRWFNL